LYKLYGMTYVTGQARAGVTDQADGPPASPGPSGRRREVLRLLRAADTPLSIAAVARQLGVHPNTARFHLDALVAGGQVEHAPPAHSRPGRPARLYRPVRRMNPAGPRRYQLLAGILLQCAAAGPEPGARAADAGRAWGRLLAGPGDAAGTWPREPAARLASLLGELGFDPDVPAADGRQQIGLRHCPFLELAQAHAPVVCGIHLGLMQGAMSAWDAPVTVSRLEPFAEPGLCVAHLAPAGDGP
jgi:predicted ArsR family transcriptional regulator